MKSIDLRVSDCDKEFPISRTNQRNAIDELRVTLVTRWGTFYHLCHIGQPRGRTVRLELRENACRLRVDATARLAADGEHQAGV
eukprot:8841442-Pyramimonas_sp.AAC.1